MFATSAPLHGFLYSTFDPSGTMKAVLYVALWVFVVGLTAFNFLFPRTRKWYRKWTTQDIFVLAILSVILLAWDTFLNDQLFGPLITGIPVIGNALDFFQLPDLPYMFIVIVTVAMIKNPGCVTALIFIKRLLGELMFSTHGVNPLNWPDALDEGVLADLYIVLRQGKVFNNARSIFWDGLVIGSFRAFPNTPIGGMFMDPFLNGQVHTYLSFIKNITGNVIGNGLEAAITAPLAVRVARSVGIFSGTDGTSPSTEFSTTSPNSTATANLSMPDQLPTFDNASPLRQASPSTQTLNEIRPTHRSESSDPASREIQEGE